MYVLLSEYNLYHQQGSYFVAAWPAKPTASELFALGLGLQPDRIEHILKGGGREARGDEWYILADYKPGTVY